MSHNIKIIAYLFFCEVMLFAYSRYGEANQDTVFVNNSLLNSAINSGKTLSSKSVVKFIYVTPDVNAPLGNGTKEKPFNTISAALKVANPGYTVRLLPGVYYGPVNFPKGGLPGRPITLTTDGSARSAVIDGQGANINGIQVNYPYVVIDGLEVRNVKNSGLKCDGDLNGSNDGNEYGSWGGYGERHNRVNGANGLVFKNNYIHNIGYDGIKVGHVNDIHIINNEVYKTGTNGQQQGIDLVGVYGAVIKDNYVHDDIDKPAMAIAIFAKGGSENILIENNFIENIVSPQAGIEVGGDTEWYNTRYTPSKVPSLNERLITLKQNYNRNEIDRSGEFKDAETYTAQYLAEARNVTVRGNLIKNADPPLSFRNAYNATVYNNTMINTGWSQGWIKLWTDGNNHHLCENIKLYNNLFYNNSVPLRNYGNIKKGMIYVEKSGGPNRKGFASDYNLYYNLGNKPISGIKGSDVDRHSMVGDPLLDANFNLKNKSPAIGAGVDLTVLGLMGLNDLFTDRNGTVFLHGKKPDIGAFAYQPEKYGPAVKAIKLHRMKADFTAYFNSKVLAASLVFMVIFSASWYRSRRSKRFMSVVKDSKIIAPHS